tara:strand:- start:593 stop:1942 length:1350 start_codon:yes stop_codon:yes gene_type:complete
MILKYIIHINISQEAELTKQKINKLLGSLKVVGDKSISHRVLIFSSLSTGKSEITNLLESEDVLSTVNVLKDLGIQIKKKGEKWIVYGNGTNGFIQPKKALNASNSGTTARLCIAAVSTNPIFCTFIGDQSLSRRPMSRITNFLDQIGAKIYLTNNDFLPLTIHGTRNAMPLSHMITKASAQIKSGLIFAALQTSGKTTIYEKKKTRDHSELLMDYLKIKNRRSKYSKEGQKISISGPQEIASKNYIVGGDPSSAAFFIVAALIVKKSQITLRDVVLNKTRIAYISILKKMGGKIKVQKTKMRSGEQLGSISVSSSKLKGISIPASLSPFLIDEYPILAIAASCAKGITTMKGLKELRFKESDRIKSIHNNLKLCSVDSKVLKDNIIIKGKENIRGSKRVIKTYNDHRIAMSFYILGLVTEKAIKLDNEECIKISYPNFKKDLKQLIVY